MFLKEVYKKENSYVFLKETYLENDCITLYKIINFRYIDFDKYDFNKIDKRFIVRMYLKKDSDIDYLIEELTTQYILN